MRHLKEASPVVGVGLYENSWEWDILNEASHVVGVGLYEKRVLSQNKAAPVAATASRHH